MDLLPLKFNKMYTKVKPPKTSIKVKKELEIGEPIEQKMRRVLNNNEPITDGAPIIFTERKDGVLPETNPRTDRWEEAAEAMGNVRKMNIAKREERMKAKEQKKESGLEGGTGGNESQA